MAVLALSLVAVEVEEAARECGNNPLRQFYPDVKMSAITVSRVPA